MPPAPSPPFMDPRYRATIRQTFDFGAAVARIKAGRKVARIGWNGTGQWVALHDPSARTSETRQIQTMTQPFLCLRTSGEIGHLVPWLPSQTDLLADDWFDAAEVWEAQRDKPAARVHQPLAATAAHS